MCGYFSLLHMEMAFDQHEDCHIYSEDFLVYLIEQRHSWLLLLPTLLYTQGIKVEKKRHLIIYPQFNKNIDHSRPILHIFLDSQNANWIAIVLESLSSITFSLKFIIFKRIYCLWLCGSAGWSICHLIHQKVSDLTPGQGTLLGYEFDR